MVEEKKTFMETVKERWFDIATRTLEMSVEHPFIAGFMLAQHVFWWILVIVAAIMAGTTKKEEA